MATTTLRKIYYIANTLAACEDTIEAFRLYALPIVRQHHGLPRPELLDCSVVREQLNDDSLVLTFEMVIYPCFVLTHASG